METFGFSAPMPQVTISNKQAFVLINERVEEHPVMGADGEPTGETVKDYVYDGVKLYNILSMNDVLPRLREYAVAKISAFDNSPKVNSFTINGKTLWLDKDTRLALRQRFAAEKAAGITSTTLWYKTFKLSLGVDTALDMLNAIEIYACKCYDITAAHKAAVQAMTNFEEILGYDFKVGYPDKLSFTTTEE